MNIDLLGDNVEITDKIRSEVDTKLGQKLEKYLTTFNEDMTHAQMTLTKDTNWGWKINFDMRLPGKKQIFADAKKETLRATLTDLRDKLIPQIKEYKDNINNNN